MTVRLGDGLLFLALLVWMSVSVGPWWVGVMLFAGAYGINIWEQRNE